MDLEGAMKVAEKLMPLASIFGIGDGKIEYKH